MGLSRKDELDDKGVVVSEASSSDVGIDLEGAKSNAGSECLRLSERHSMLERDFVSSRVDKKSLGFFRCGKLYRKTF